jgi:hypothetical protein
LSLTVLHILTNKVIFITVIICHSIKKSLSVSNSESDKPHLEVNIFSFLHHATKYTFSHFFITQHNWSLLSTFSHGSYMRPV